MRFLEYFRLRNRRGDGKHRDAAAVGIAEAIGQRVIARPAGSGADCGPAGDLGLTGGRKNCGIHVPYVDPFDLVGPTLRLD